MKRVQVCNLIHFNFATVHDSLSSFLLKAWLNLRGRCSPCSIETDHFLHKQANTESAKPFCPFPSASAPHAKSPSFHGVYLSWPESFSVLGGGGPTGTPPLQPPCNPLTPPFWIFFHGTKDWRSIFFCWVMAYSSGLDETKVIKSTLSWSTFPSIPGVPSILALQFPRNASSQQIRGYVPPFILSSLVMFFSSYFIPPTNHHRPSPNGWFAPPATPPPTTPPANPIPPGTTIRSVSLWFSIMSFPRWMPYFPRQISSGFEGFWRLPPHEFCPGELCKRPPARCTVALSWMAVLKGHPALRASGTFFLSAPHMHTPCYLSGQLFFEK